VTPPGGPPVVLVLNTGSSSVKYRVLDMADRTVLAGGLLEGIGEPRPRLTHRPAGRPVDERDVAAADHAEGLQAVTEAFDRSGGMPAEPVAIGHRVVHGGDRFDAPTVIDDEVVAAIRELVPLAPLHNPANLTGIEVARERYPRVPHVAVFDTAFHRTMPAHAQRYALPRALADRHGVHRYGFHGTSHAHVSRRAARHLERPIDELHLITLHLGNGASAAAVAGGRCIDTSMGLTPLQGLVMGTRSGDVDPGVIFHLHREAGLGLAEIENLLNRESGLLGLAGASDLREVRRRAEGGDADAAEAIDVFCYRVRAYVGAYAAALGRVDALVFTAGIGENDPGVRESVCAGLAGFGVRLDPRRNRAASAAARTVSASGSAVAVLVVPTDEELEIAEQTLALVRGAPGGPPDAPPARR
jgi:acetate kinase